MASEVLTQIASQFGDVEKQIAEAEELIRAMQDAGENVSTMQADIAMLKTRRDKWVRMLAARGLTKGK